jgi:hypothetical protein
LLIDWGGHQVSLYREDDSFRIQEGSYRDARAALVHKFRFLHQFGAI